MFSPDVQRTLASSSVDIHQGLVTEISEALATGLCNLPGSTARAGQTLVLWALMHGLARLAIERTAEGTALPTLAQAVREASHALAAGFCAPSRQSPARTTP